MKILISSHCFAPSVGGIESVTQTLTDQFLALGHEVRIITQTPEPATLPHPFPILRNPSRAALLDAVRWCDVFWHNNISLQTAWPLLRVRRPWVVTAQTWIRDLEGKVGIRERIKRVVIRNARNVAISQAIARHLPGHPVIIGNPYDDATFRLHPDVPRDQSLVFLGRLVSSKGADLLLDALALLPEAPRLTIIGGGPEEANLRRQVAELGLRDRVNFAGVLQGEALARALNRHDILVVPSRWEEPFGVVALEGIACGCTAIGSGHGGLADPIGPCGALVSDYSAAGLAAVLTTWLSDSERLNAAQKAAPTHLRKFRARAIAEAYLTLFQKALAR